MKNLLYIILIFITAQTSVAQQMYCDFEGTKVISFGLSTGIMDSLFFNPAPNSANTSANCAQYVRNSTLYDNFKLYPDTTLEDVTAYAINNTQAPKITMKVYTTAPVGTVVQVQLGLKSNDTYPSGVHSEYTASTTVQNVWESLTFNYFQSPIGSLVLPTQINKIVVLLQPNTTSQDTMYFDDLMGPALAINTTGVPEVAVLSNLKLYPNPAKDNTHISFQLSKSGAVSLELFDLLGNSISSLIDQDMKAGSHSIPIETSTIPNGIYFYVLKREVTLLL